MPEEAIPLYLKNWNVNEMIVFYSHIRSVCSRRTFAGKRVKYYLKIYYGKYTVGGVRWRSKEAAIIVPAWIFIIPFLNKKAEL